MPIHGGYDGLGFYYQYGNHGHKYYYLPDETGDSERAAYLSAVRQGAAIHSNGGA